jgi:thiol:disulfide interchange protein DsbC
MKKLFVSAALLWLSVSAVAAEVPEETIREQIKKIDPNIPVESIEAAPMDGFFEVTLGSGEVLYVDKAGEYFLLGKLYHLTDEKGFVSLTDQKQNALRAQLLGEQKDEDMIVYKAEGEEKNIVYVFTDVDCPYCRKLHDEVPKLQAKGITVKYLAYPRQGPGSPVYHKMAGIWCAEDRNLAMDEAKGGKPVKPSSCENPVNQQFELGQKVGVTGTPAILTTEGKLIPGYMPADRLEAMLNADS